MLLESDFQKIIDSDNSQRNVLIVMKTVLSYFHTIHPDLVDEQGDSVYLLMIPILIVYGEQGDQVIEGMMGNSRTRQSVGSNYR